MDDGEERENETKHHHTDTTMASLMSMSASNRDSDSSSLASSSSLLGESKQSHADNSAALAGASMARIAVARRRQMATEEAGPLLFARRVVGVTLL